MEFFLRKLGLRGLLTNCNGLIFLVAHWRRQLDVILILLLLLLKAATILG